MCRCCEIIKYWLCCYKGEEDEYDDFGIEAYINWSEQFTKDDLYGAVVIDKENNR